MANPLDNLPPELKARLRGLSDTMQIDKITVSFSIEERGLNGRKESAFYSVTASRGTGAEVNQLSEMKEHSPAGYTPAEAKVARLLLGKHVVASVYDDAVRRGMMKASTAKEEVLRILGQYDYGIAKLMQSEWGEKSEATTTPSPSEAPRDDIKDELAKILAGEPK
jgi:hypothetical protein